MVVGDSLWGDSDGLNVEQRKYDDICRIMGINYQSVRNLMHRSLLRLRFMAARI